MKHKRPPTFFEHLLGNVIFALFMSCLVALELHNVGKTNWPAAFLAGGVLAALSWFLKLLGHDKIVAAFNVAIILVSVFHYLYNLLFA